MILYGYFRSSATYRVRIALALKDISYQTVPVNLLKGEHLEEAYGKINPQHAVPALIDDGHVLTQSITIMEYLEERHPKPPLLPKAPHERARVRTIAHAVAADIAPLNIPATMKYLAKELHASDEQKTAWYAHWIAEGFAALETMLKSDPATGKFCHGDQPTLADCCLLPQVFNAQRYKCNLAPYPTILRIAEACDAHPAFQAAHPSKQPDAV